MEERCLVSVHRLLEASLVVVSLGTRAGTRIVSRVIRGLFRGNIVGSRRTCGGSVVGHRRRNSAKVNSNVTVPRTRGRTIGRPTMVFTGDRTNISCSSLSKRPTRLFFVVTTPRNNSGARLRTLTTLSRMLVGPSIADTLGSTSAPRGIRTVFTSTITEGRTRGGTRRRTRGRTSGTRTNGHPCVITIATYPGNVTRACVTRRGLGGTTRGLNISVGIRAGNSRNIGRLLSSSRVTHTGNIIVTTSGGITVTHFGNGRLVSGPMADTVGGPRRLVRAVLSNGTPTCGTRTNRRRSSSTSSGSAI